MKRIISVILVISVLASVFAASVSAQTPYSGYTYNAWKESVPSPTGYMPDEYYRGSDYECGAFSNPQDFFIDRNGIMYVVDTGNNRIVKFDENMNFIGIIDSMTDGEETVTFNQPEGMYVHEDGSIYVADAGNGRVIVANSDLTVRSYITKPVESDIYDQNDELIPIRVFADMSGIVYILSRSNNKGILTFDEGGEFLAYYGTPPVQVTAEVLLYALWEPFMSDAQRESYVSFTPIEYKSITLGSDNFVYATQYVSTWNNKNQLKRLNPKGINVAKQRRRFYQDIGNSDLVLGDSEVRVVGNTRTGNNFTDTALNADSTMLFMLDTSQNKVFAYDNDLNLLYVFGASGRVNGQQLGTFLSPVAVEVRGTTVYVLDSEDLSITSFEQTTFGELVQEGIMLYNKGDYAAAVEPWTEVLKYNSNYDVAYISLSKAEFEAGNYENAIEYAKIAFDRASYEDAYVEVRSAYLARNFNVIFISIVVIILAIAIVPRVIKSKKKKKAGGVNK